MIDKTTVGISAEPEEVEAVLHNLCGYHLAERDPVFRYTVLTREQVLYDGLVAAIKRERGRALAELVASGTTMTHAARLTNLTSRQQVQRLIALAKAAEEAVAEVAAAASEISERLAAATDFENRMAAVEATLDEVVSGITPPEPEVGVESAPPPAFDQRGTGEFDVVVAADPTPLGASFATAGFADADSSRSPAPAVAVQSEAPAPVLAPPVLAPPVVAGPPIVPVPWTGDDLVDAATAWGEQTQTLPTLSPLLQQPRETPPAEETRWWRRNRDSGAA
jgi:hypothetical protein